MQSSYNEYKKFNLKKMKHLFFFVSVSILLASCQTTVDKKTKSLESEYLVQATLWYQQAEEMQACYYQAYNLAKLQLKNNLENYKGTKKTAVVLDIDETVLDNSPFEADLIKNEKSYTHELWKIWTDAAVAKAVPGVLEFTNYAKSLGVEVIYISNRKTDELQSTIDNLRKEALPNADSNFVLLKEKTSDKTLRREQVAETFEILLFIGDNLGDFDQVFQERENNSAMQKVKENKELFGRKYIVLPNPMYGHWEKKLFESTKKLNPQEKIEIRKNLLKGF